MAKRRDAGEGTMRQLKSGKWQCQIMIGRHPDGRRKYVSFTADTKAEVKRMVKEYRDKEKQEGKAEVKTFGQVAELWYQRHRDYVTERTYESYKYTLRILLAHFENWNIREIKTRDIEDFLTELQMSGRSKSYRAKCRAMLFQIFAEAEGNDEVSRNPVANAKKASRNKMLSDENVKTSKNKKDSFRQDEVRELIDKLPNDKVGNSIRLMIGTGLRTQELLSLEKCHIAEDGSRITIAQAVTECGGRASVASTKTASSEREVLVPDGLQDAVKSLRTGIKGTYLWESSRKVGFPCNPKTFRDEYKKAVQSIENVRYLTPHCCRHTFVSMMQLLGVDAPTIQSFAGHSKIDMTMHYLHVQEEVRQNAASRYSNFLLREE